MSFSISSNSCTSVDPSVEEHSSIPSFSPAIGQPPQANLEDTASNTSFATPDSSPQPSQEREHSQPQFTLFSTFPLELQRAIWDMACLEEKLEQRVLPIAPTQYKNLWPSRPAILVNRSMPLCLRPPMLRTCGYARKVALQNYMLWPCASRRKPKSKRLKKHGRKIFVKPDIDIFYLADDQYENYEFLRVFVLTLQGTALPTPQNFEYVDDDLLPYKVAHFAIGSKLYMDLFIYFSFWTRSFANIKGLTIINGESKALRRVTAGSLPAFLRVAARATRSTAPRIFSRWDLNVFLGIIETPELKVANDKTDLVRPVALKLLGPVNS